MDVSQSAGLPVTFDERSERLISAEYLPLTPVERLGDELKPVLRYPDEISSEELLYTLYYPEANSAAGRQLAQDGLQYCLVVVPSRVIGDEYLKTYGHFHLPMAPGPLEYPEVYTVLHGTGHFVMQREASGGRGPQCCVLRVTTGEHFLIPPGWGHCSVNTAAEPLVFAGLYSNLTATSRKEYTQRRGAAAFVLQGDDGPVVAVNDFFKPDIREVRITGPQGTPFAWPDVRPLWTQYAAQPNDFAFLRDSAAARKRFTSQG